MTDPSHSPEFSERNLINSKPKGCTCISSLPNALKSPFNLAVDLINQHYRGCQGCWLSSKPRKEKTQKSCDSLGFRSPEYVLRKEPTQVRGSYNYSAEDLHCHMTAVEQKGGLT